MKVACPGMGLYSDAIIKELGSYLNWEIISPVPSEETIELGTKHLASELMCLPAKVTLGSMIKACEQGAQDLIMFDSCGLCRLKTYWILQERALRKLGFNATVHPIRLGKMTPSDICAVDRSIPYWKACWAFFKVLRKVIEIDRQQLIEIPGESSLVKVGIVGEIYSILEPAVNRDIIKKIGRMGALVHNSLPLSYFVFKRFYNRGWMKRREIDRQVFLTARKTAHGLMPKEIGGHGNESIIHTIYYGLKRFDGVIHILPFPCAPEAVAAPILDDISRDYHIPVMRLIFDVHTGEAGLNTRLEAFVDILQRRKRLQPSHGQRY